MTTRIRIADPTDNFQPRTVAPSSTLAGLYARTDAERGVWKAPAGLDARIRGDEGVHWPITGPEYLDEQYRAQAALLRDLFGHLFHADALWVGRLEHAARLFQRRT